jgi:hypothetical protein
MYRISLLFSEAFLQVKELMEKTYSETEQNMSEKQGKGQIMLLSITAMTSDRVSS